MASMSNRSDPPVPGPASETADQQRPKNLLQRLSSGLSTILPSISSRRGSSSTHTSDRPETAPSHTHKHRRRKARSRRDVPDDEQLIVPQLNIPPLSDTDTDTHCPYDPSTYHSFPSIEDERCSFCGLRPFPRTTSAISTSHRPCSNCRSRTPSSHLASSFRRSSRRTSASRATSSNLPPLDETSDEIPRIVPYEVAAGRIGNPPRTSTLPVGVRPSYSTTHLSPDQIRDPRTQHHKALHSSSSPRDARPVSPRLHHYNLLPHPHSHPYVHKSEVEQHMAALEAGSPSPLPQVLDEGPTIPNPNEPYRDFSRTVYYGTTPSSAASTASSLVIRRMELIDQTEGPLGRSRLSLRVDRVEIRGGQRMGRESGRRRARTSGQAARSRNDQRPSETSAAQTVITPVANEILLIEDGTEELHLRGGGAEDRLSATSSPIPISTHHSHSTRPARTNIHPQSSVIKSSTREHAHYKHDDSPTQYQPSLGLRGGASSPLPSPVRVPPTLYFLAGGTGRRPITVGSWKKQRGTRRFGGLLGMAVYGRKAGSTYRRRNCDDERSHRDEGDVESLGEDGDVEEEEMKSEGVGSGNSIGRSSRMGSTKSSPSSSLVSSLKIGSQSRSRTESSATVTRSARSRLSRKSGSRNGSVREKSERGRRITSRHSTIAGSTATSTRSAAPFDEGSARERPADDATEPGAENGAKGLHEGQDEDGVGEWHGNEGRNASARA